MEPESGKYRHYKGGVYEVIGTARNSETLEEMVVYISVKDGQMWVRPRKMFLEEVDWEGRKQPRFQKIE
jgi:hypothetical protein